MSIYISILRGINVGGKNMIKMTELLTMFQSLAFEKVKTYIQSGNVIFQHEGNNAEELEKLIEKQILHTFGFNVPVMVKTLAEVEAVIKNNPFSQDKDVVKLHVTFLSAKPQKENIDKIKPEQYLPDELIIKEKVIYLYCPNGYGNTKLNNNFFESKLKVTATTRNWKTVNELVSMANTIS